MITEIIMNPLLEVAEVSVGQHYYWRATRSHVKSVCIYSKLA
jgi:hypothetical protein